MERRKDILQLLADGRFHSGEALGRALGIGRSAVWKTIRRLPSLGLEVHGVRGKGYRLAEKLALLDAAAVRSGMGPDANDRLSAVEVLLSVPSTNRYVLERAGTGLASGAMVLAEHQSAGRGRRGRPWQSPFGVNLYLSFLWRFDQPAAAVSAFSLAAGVAVARVVREICGIEVGIKWPNDILSGGRKLAGILLEISGEPGGPCHLVTGIGLNVNMVSTGAGIDQPWTSLRLLTGSAIDRNLVAGKLAETLVDMAVAFEARGLSSFSEDWDRLDLSRGREVTLAQGTRRVVGMAMGLDGTGALRVRVGDDVESFHSGEVSLRLGT